MIPEHSRAVFFDAGFTLIEPAEPVAQTYARVARSVGVELPPDEFAAHFKESWKTVNRNYRSAHDDLASSDELERESWRRFTREVAQPYPALLQRHEEWFEALINHFDAPASWKLLPGAFEVLASLRNRGLTLGLVSNWHSALHRILAAHRLESCFAFVLTSAETGRKKPHQRIFSAAVDSAGVEASHCCHVGDSWDDDVLGALNAKVAPIWFDRSDDVPREDQRVKVVQSLHQLLKNPS